MSTADTDDSAPSTGAAPRRDDELSWTPVSSPTAPVASSPAAEQAAPADWAPDSSPTPTVPVRTEPPASPVDWIDTGHVAEPRVVPRRRPVMNVLLFLATLVTTTYWGFVSYQGFYAVDGGDIVFNPFAAPGLLLAAIPLGLSVIAFLLAHEMGHYVACRYYDIPASLPYFLPFPSPPFLLPGTMGAVIRIKGPISSRRALFDIAVAGPLAGFVVALPILAVGLTQSRVIDPQSFTDGRMLTMGEPLIWTPLAALFAPTMFDGQDLHVHPLAFVGWFALLVTSMNLLPVGQLDGGHLLYAFSRRWHRPISLAIVGLMTLAGFYLFPGWIFFALMVFFVLGTKHPPVPRYDQSLGPMRVALALLAVVIFVVSFMLVPIHGLSL